MQSTHNNLQRHLVYSDSVRADQLSPKLWLSLIFAACLIAVGTAKSVNVLTAVHAPPQDYVLIAGR